MITASRKMEQIPPCLLECWTNLATDLKRIKYRRVKTVTLQWGDPASTTLAKWIKVNTASDISNEHQVPAPA